MTPAVRELKRAKVSFHIHKYEHDSQVQSYGEEAATQLDISFDRVFKTLVVSLDKAELAVTVLPVSHQLDLKRFARVVGVKKVCLVDKKDVERSTGYILGGVSPVGQKRKLKTYIDHSATNFETIFVSAGKRGLEIEIGPVDLQSVTKCCFVNICRFNES